MKSGFIGIDLGTSAVKLILMDELGIIHKTISKKYPIYFPKPGWSEQNPYDWYDKVLKGMKELLQDCSLLVKGISFGGQMHGLVVLDEEDHIIRPAILWNDGRASKECDYLNNVVGQKLLSEETGNIAFAGFTAPKLLWMKANEPEYFAAIKKIMLPKDYLVYRLSGVHATDVSDASGMLLFDVKNRRWSEKMCEICHISVSQLPKIFESFEVVGTLKRELADTLGLDGDVKIIAGAGDNAAAAIGTGTIENGDCNVSIGTSGTIFIALDTYSVDQKNALHAFAHANGKYHLMGCMLSAASCNKWWIEDILGETNYAQEQKDIIDLGNNEVYFLPYLMGERSPHNDVDARGTFIGMSMETTRTQMTQAILEGVAFALRDSLEVARCLGVQIERIKICGGGAKSKLWKKIIANVLNVKIDSIESEEGPALGGAMLAAVGCGYYNTVGEAVKAIVKIKDTIEPDQAIAIRYDKKYIKFKSIYPSLKEVYHFLRENHI